MRNIFINGRFLCQPVTGAQRYAHELLTHLDLLLAASPAAQPVVAVLVPPSATRLPAFRYLRILRVGKCSGHLWEQLELPFHARQGLLFTPSGGAPLFHSRNVVTIHDAAVAAAPGGYSFAFAVWYRFLYQRLCRKALHVLTVSHFSKAELIRWYGASPDKISVTYLGSDHALRPAPEPGLLARKGLLKHRYVLLVSSSNPNKNIAGVLKALPFLAGSDVQIALVGHKDPRVFGSLQLSGEPVHDLGYVNDSDLRTLYENAACFVFPSLYEGFGLPPLEAMALGCPTVVSASTSLIELFKDVALLCDPKDPEDIAAKILVACQLSADERRQSQEFARAFRWEDCAAKTWEVIARLVNSTLGDVESRSCLKDARNNE